MYLPGDPIPRAHRPRQCTVGNQVEARPEYLRNSRISDWQRTKARVDPPYIGQFSGTEDSGDISSKALLWFRTFFGIEFHRWWGNWVADLAMVAGG